MAAKRKPKAEAKPDHLAAINKMIGRGDRNKAAAYVRDHKLSGADYDAIIAAHPEMIAVIAAQ